jgi:2-keto-3-deoxy-L-rhamnonate aldolase RhmA
MAAAATAVIDPACRAHGKFARAGFVTDETLLRRYISMGARAISVMVNTLRFANRTYRVRVAELA